MRYIEYGTQAAQVSEVVLGTMRIAPLAPAEVATLIESAVDCGVNAVDTAAIYGPSEGLIGEALALRPGLRDRIWLQTKLGIRKHPVLDANYFDFSRAYIFESVDASLRALRTDHIDSLLLHRPDVLMEPEEIAGAFDELRAAGKVLDFGVSNQNVAQMHRLQRALPQPLAANQVQLSCAFTPAFDASLNVNMENAASPMREDGIFEYACEHGQAVQAWSVLQHGYFGGVFLGSPDYPELNAALARIAAEHGVTKTAVAVNWVLRHPAKMQAIVGTTRPERLREAAAACEWQMTREEWYELYLSAGNRLP